MAGVPEIKAPTVNPEAAPTGMVAPTPGPGPFSGFDIGSGLTDVGKDLFSNALESYQSAAVAFAQDKETEFQKRALEIRDKYRGLERLDAVKAHANASAELEAVRNEIAGSITSKHAKSIYENNSLRKMQFVQESMDQHFEEEEKNYRKFSYQQGQQQRVNNVAAWATDPFYNHDKIEAELQEVHDNAKQFLRGADPKTAEDFANNEVHKATDGLFGVLMDKDRGFDPALVKSELAHFAAKGWIDPSTQRRVGNSIGGHEVDDYVLRTTAGFSRRSAVHTADGKGLLPDPEGFVPEEQVQKALGEIRSSGDPQAKKKADALTEWYSKEQARYARAGNQLRSVVVANGEVGKEGSLDWQKYQSLYPVEAQAMTRKQANWTYTQSRHAQITIKQMSGLARGDTRNWLDSLTQDQISATTKEDVQAHFAEATPMPHDKFDPNDEARSVEYFEKLKAGKSDPMERRFRTIALDVLGEKFKGNRARVMAAMNPAYMFLEDQFKAHEGKIDEKTLRQALADEATKKNGVFGSAFLGEIPLLNYKSPPNAKPGIGNAPFNLPEVTPTRPKGVPDGWRYVTKGTQHGWIGPKAVVPAGWKEVGK